MAEAANMHDRLFVLALEVDWDDLYRVCDEIETRPDGQTFVPDLLAILENNPDFDFGATGPIIHTIEKFYHHGCVKHVIQSVRSTPTYYTLLMLRRLMNWTEGEERDIYIALLREVAAGETRTPYIRELAQYWTLEL